MTSLEREIAKLHDEMVNAPNNIELKLKYGHACLMRDWRLEALSVYEDVLNLQDNAEAHLALAKIFALQTYYTEAYDELRKLFKVDPINMQGHIMLHLLQEDLPIPEDLAQHLDFVPSSDYLLEQRKILLADRDFLDSQIAEYSALVFGVSEPEPILQYCVLETRKSKERLAKLLAKCDEWAKSALPGGFIKDSSDSISDDIADTDLIANDVASSPLETSENAEVISEAGASVATDNDNVAAAEAEGSSGDVVEPEGAEAQVIDENGVVEPVEQAPAKSTSGDMAAVPVETAPAGSTSASGAHQAIEGEGAGELADAPAPEPHFEVIPEREGASEQQVEAGAEPETAPVPQEEYTVDSERVNVLMEPLFNIRGVNSAVLYRRGSGVILSVGSVASSDEHLRHLGEGIIAWYELNDTLNCWIIEGESGIEYIHRIGSHFMLVINSTSTNLGALRIGIDKIVPDLEKAL